MNAPWWRLAAESQQGPEPIAPREAFADDAASDLDDWLPPFVD